MNVYDFDNTIYDGDSTVDFYLFCLKRHKKIATRCPSLLFAFLKFYVFKIGTKTQFKETMYRFLTFCDIDKDLADFWDKHKSNIKDWYLKQKRIDDVIISASPQFLLDPIGEKLGFDVIASKVDKFTGKYNGENCYYKEKVSRFYEKYPNSEIEEFYSDHYSDEPLANISKKAFIVDGNKILNWNYNTHIKPRI
ncbi:MAG: phosphoserine phosphatase [Ruminococcaceae bacterium]|nr:phosphoserine phosphatase [Oscillospiraceae bacterium]